jgi:hypothetical protein
LGDFPKFIKPFVFAWPAAGPITYWNARTAIESDHCRQDFVDMIKQLTKTGYSRFHILAHSMGTRMPLGIADRMEELFRPTPGVQMSKSGTILGDINGSPTDLPELLTLTFLNAENDLTEFIDYKYELLRKHCKIITITADPTDGALGYANIFGNVYPNKSALRPDLWYKPMGMFPSEFYKEDKDVLIPGAKGSRPLRRYLDVDVINTSSLDANAAGIRHSYFSLNRLTVDDIRDVIVYRLRAKDRMTRLLPKDGNEFSYLSAPSWIRK